MLDRLAGFFAAPVLPFSAACFLDAALAVAFAVGGRVLQNGSNGLAPEQGLLGTHNDGKSGRGLGAKR